MEYKHLLEICEQLLKYSALPTEMLDKYYSLKERTLKLKSDLHVKILNLISSCCNSMLSQHDINIQQIEVQINNIIDLHQVPELRTEFSKAFQLILQLNSERKEQDATVTYQQNEIKKLKLELSIANAKQDQIRKQQQSEEKDKTVKLQRIIDELREEIQTKEEEHEEQLNRLQKNATSEEFFDQFAELSLPYLERFERDFEKHQIRKKKYSENVSEKDILLDFLFYLLEKYVPTESQKEHRSSAKKTQPSPKSSSSQKELHFEQYSMQTSKIDETYNKLKQELVESRKTLDKYEQSRNKLTLNLQNA